METEDREVITLRNGMLRYKVDLYLAQRMRYSLRDHGLDPSRMTDQEVLDKYKQTFGEYMYCHPTPEDS